MSFKMLIAVALIATSTPAVAATPEAGLNASPAAQAAAALPEQKAASPAHDGYGVVGQGWG